jgi:ATP/maltotriose-dependent transcriptional regulator MalT
VNSTVVSPVFVGRRDELATISTAIAQAAAAEPAFALIGGEAGVGKTRLVDEAKRLASEQGFVVLVGRCVEMGAEGLPLAPLVDALRELARTTSPEELDALLGSARRGLARLLPELDPGAPADGSADGGRASQLLELVLGVVGRISREQPLMLVFEDLHWADQSTLELAAFLVRSLRGVRALLVITYRSDEMHRRHPLRPLVTEWERVRSMQRLQLRRFDHDEVHAQIDAILSTHAAAEMIDIVFDRSGGNAFLVEELVGVVRAGGDPRQLPPSLRDVLLSRVDALDESTQRLVRTAAVAGRRVSDRLLAAVAELDDEALYRSLREAVEAHLLIVDETGSGYTFRHALARDAVYEDMLPGERVRLHAAYGEALTANPALAEGDAALSAALAYHWYAALDLPRALSASVEAAQQATSAYAPAEALRHLERALEIWPRVPDAAQRTGVDQIEVSRRAAGAAYMSGNMARSLLLLGQVLSEPSVQADPERHALLLERRAVALRDSGRELAGIADLERALALLPAEPSTRARASILGTLAGAQMRVSAMTECVDVAKQAVEAARAVGARDVEADALISLGSAQSYLDTNDAGLELGRRGIEIARELDLPITMLRGYINISDVLCALGRYDEAAETARVGMTAATPAGLTRSLGNYLAGNLVESLLRLGEWDEAEQLAREALRTEPEGIFAATVLIVCGELAVMRGKYAEAAEVVSTTRRTLGDSTDIQFTQSLAYLGALTARGRGDLTTALALVIDGLGDEIYRWLARYAWPLLWAGVLIQADLAVAARDRRSNDGEAAKQETPFEKLAASIPVLSLPALGYQATVKAEQARAAGVDELACWSRAVDAWRPIGEAYALTYSLVRLAQAHCAHGDRDAATTVAREALGRARLLSATPLIDELMALSRRARLPITDADDASAAAVASSDEKPATDELARFGLTDREREVLVLLTAGRSNPQIAQELFISPKTASVHVSNILAKLGVSGRVEAAAVAHRLGLVE